MLWAFDCTNYPRQCWDRALPDADLFGDEGSATLQNTAQAVGGLYCPICS